MSLISLSFLDVYASEPYFYPNICVKDGKYQNDNAKILTSIRSKKLVKAWINCIEPFPCVSVSILWLWSVWTTPYPQWLVFRKKNKKIENEGHLPESGESREKNIFLSKLEISLQLKKHTCLKRLLVQIRSSLLLTIIYRCTKHYNFSCNWAFLLY